MRFELSTINIVLWTISIGFSQHQDRTKLFNLSDGGVAIDGYDPVSYFVDHRPTEGKKELSLTIDGVVYYFSSAANRDTFKANPAQYEPVYGGWCAFAMGDTGNKVEVDPETFKIINGKLYLFYNKFFNNTLNSWNKDEPSLRKKADSNWQRIVMP